MSVQNPHPFPDNAHLSRDAARCFREKADAYLRWQSVVRSVPVEPLPDSGVLPEKGGEDAPRPTAS